MKQLLCRLLGHKWQRGYNPIGHVYKHFTAYYGELRCARCRRRVVFVCNIEPEETKGDK